MIGILSQDTISKAKSIDLLSYLQRYEPDELIHVASNEYSTKSHGSLKISNGKWHWFSKGIGGSTALDYLINVKGLRFTDAVMQLTGYCYKEQLKRTSVPQKNSNKPLSKSSQKFALPPAHPNSDRVIDYLQTRGISLPVIQYCLDQKLLYEDDCYNNAVFVGFDPSGTPRHAMLRGTSPGNSFRHDAPGSDKRFTFALLAKPGSDQLYVYESAIDLLSHATIDCAAGIDWQKPHRLSLAGLAPLALDQYIKDHPEIKSVILCLDQDEPGRVATRILSNYLSDTGKTVRDEHAPVGKDYNDYLCSLFPTTVQLLRGQDKSHSISNSR